VSGRPILPRDRPDEQPAAHPDPPVDAPSVDDEAALLERLLPGHDMGIHRVDEGAVEVEDEGAHRADSAMPPGH